MDPISIAVSIAGLASSAGTLIKVASNFASSVKRSSGVVESLVEELNALQRILEKLEAFLDAQDVDHIDFGESSILLAKSTALHTKLTLLAKKFKNISENKFQQFTWPLKQKEFDDSVAEIRAFCHLIHFALTVDACSLLSKTSDNIVKTLLQQLDGLKLLNSIDEKIIPLQRSIEEQTRVLEDDRQNKQHHSLVAWLGGTGQEIYHDRVRSQRVAGTGHWVLEHEQFLSWKAGLNHGNTLWCYGEMGAGKTQISSLIIDQLNDDIAAHERALTYFYFNYADAHAQSATKVVETLLHQLVGEESDSIPTALAQLYKKHAQSNRPTFADLEETLKQVIAERSLVYIVFDALDECDASQHRKEFLRLLGTLQQCSNARIAVTSRPYPQDIKKALSQCPTLKIQADDQDLRYFVRTRLHEAGIEDLFDDKFESEVADFLVQSADGIFLLPAMQLQFILGEPTRGDMEDALRVSPSSLAGIFDNTINRIQRQSESRRYLALNTLMWTSQSQRPLRDVELCDALSMDVRRGRALNKRYMPTPAGVVDCCQGLVYLDDTTKTFHLTHAAVREHLLSNGQRIFGDCPSLLAAVSCLHYVLDEAFEDGPSPNSLLRSLEMVDMVEKTEGAEGAEEAGESDESDKSDSSELSEHLATETEIDDFLGKHPFFEYLSREWGWHITQCQMDSTVNDRVLCFLSSPSRVARVSQIASYSKGYRFLYWNLAESWSIDGLHLACDAGLTKIVCDLIDTGKSRVDCATRMGTTALIRACSAEKLETMRELLKRGADPLRSNWYGNSLHCAAEAGCPRTMRELLDRGIDPDVRSPHGRTPLSCAMDRHSVDAVQVMLEYGASLYYSKRLHKTCTRLFYTSVLREAVSEDAVLIVELMIGKKYLVHDESDVDGMTLLHRAAMCGHLEMTKLLVNSGISDVNAKTDSGFGAISYATDQAIVDFLLIAGSDPLPLSINPETEEGEREGRMGEADDDI